MDQHRPSEGVSRRTLLIGTAAGMAGAAVAQPAPSSGSASGQGVAIVETEGLKLVVDPARGCWSATAGNGMAMRDTRIVADPFGWSFAARVDPDEASPLGHFARITVLAHRAGELELEYRLRVNRAMPEIIVDATWVNRSDKAVRVEDLVYFASEDTTLGGETDRWVSIGTHSRNRDYYELLPVRGLVEPRMYEVNQVIRHVDSGNTLLLGHVTVFRGASRFEVAQGWEDKSSGNMHVRAFCNYKIDLPAGGTIEGEKLLVSFSRDALRAMERQGDLIAIAHDVRLKQRRPIDLDDKLLTATNYSRFHSWMSGGTVETARTFFARHNLEAYTLGGVRSTGVASASFGLYGNGGAVMGVANRTNYPASSYLTWKTPRYGAERVIDFSRADTVQLEVARARAWASTASTTPARVETDFSDFWDKWPGQHDPSMSAVETYRAGTMPWRKAIDELAPRRVIRSNMNAVDFSYGIVDICRISEDADRGYEVGASPLLPKNSDCLFTETVMSSANRFFYNGRVFWNDGDGFHIYKYVNPDGKNFTYGQGKVVANFRALSSNTILVSEAFDEEYPDDRIELLKRVSPPTSDVGYPVDLFDRRPAQIWNMPIERPFGRWSVLGVFNYTHKLRLKRLSNNWIKMLDGADPTPFEVELDAERDLRLNPKVDYLAFEFWSKTFIGRFRGKFVPRPVEAYDCDVYAIVEDKGTPALISTSRHVRQMAVDIKALSFNRQRRSLSGTSRMVTGDPYTLYVYVPPRFTFSKAVVGSGLRAEVKRAGELLQVTFVSTDDRDATWEISFR